MPWQEAGDIVDTYNAGTIVFLNFSRYRDDFTLVVFGEAFDRFPEPPERLYDEQRVWATGRVELYQRRPQMAIAGPVQMRVMGPAG